MFAHHCSPPTPLCSRRFFVGLPLFFCAEGIGSFLRSGGGRDDWLMTCAVRVPCPARVPVSARAGGRVGGHGAAAHGTFSQEGRARPRLKNNPSEGLFCT